MAVLMRYFGFVDWESIVELTDSVIAHPWLQPLSADRPLQIESASFLVETIEEASDTTQLIWGPIQTTYSVIRQFAEMSHNRNRRQWHGQYSDFLRGLPGEALTLS